jgi:hypothetical protein
VSVNENIFVIAPKRYDYLSATIIEGLQELGVKVSAIHNSNYASRSFNFFLNNDSSNIVLDFCGNSKSRNLINFIKKLYRNKIFVRVDGSDGQSFKKSDFEIYNLIFKRELSDGFTEFRKFKVYPINFAIEKRYEMATDLNTRDILLSFMCNFDSNTMRRAIETVLLNDLRENFFVGDTGERSYIPGDSKIYETKKYSNIMRRSFSSINVAGRGFDCGRYWEILGAKTLLISQVPNIHIVNKPIDGHHAIYFRDQIDISEIIANLENNRSNLERIRIEGSIYALNYHTSKKRSAYLLEIIKSIPAADLNRLVTWQTSGFLRRLVK